MRGDIIYDIKNKFIYEILEDFQEVVDDKQKKEIFDAFLNKLWSIKNPRQKYNKSITYKVSDKYNDDISDIFRNYQSITYKACKSITKNKNNWYLLRQKINNLYTNMCDDEICFKSDVMKLLREPKKLYYRYVQGEGEDLGSAKDLKLFIEKSLIKAKVLSNKYSNQKIKISWNEYNKLISDCLFKIFNNYIPLEEYEDKNLISINIDCWNEDNYVVKYIGKSLSGYMRNYQKEYFNLKRNKEYKLCSCGGLLEKIPSGIDSRKGYHYKCNLCRKEEYQPIGNKTIICVDCGKEVEVDSKDNNRIRCDKCYKTYRREYYRLNKQKQRQSNKMSTNQFKSQIVTNTDKH